MSRRTKFYQDQDVPLLTQERIAWGDEKKVRRKRTRLVLARRIAIRLASIFVVFVLAFFLLCGLAVGAFDGIRSVIAGSVIDYFNDIKDKCNSTPESKPQGDAAQKNESTESDTENTEPLPEEREPMTLEALYSFDLSAVPEGQKAIIPMDLSLYSNGVTYINNQTGYTPDTELLLKRELNTDVSLESLGASDCPQVLIIHTHGTEAFLEDGAISYLDDGGELARSEDKTKNVVALGEQMANILNEKGIMTVHCSFMHDSVGYRNSYARAEQTIKEYLENYPTIKLVIDLHRDGVVRSTGELVRPVTLVDGEAAAQVMCVVGSDFGGEEYPSWQNNLSLALKLRNELNGEYVNLCRPTELRSNTYNQEFSKYSLLLEIGSCANSFEEAIRTTELVAKALVNIIGDM